METSIPSEELLDALFRLSRDAIAVVDENLCVRERNPAFVALFAGATDEISPRVIAEYFPLFAKGPIPEYVTTTCLRIDRTAFLAEVSSAPLPHGWKLLCIRDVSERRRREMDDEEQELRVRTAVAYDLHDLVGQSLAGARIFAQNAMRDAPPELRERFSRVVALLADAIERVRTTSHTLAAIEVESPFDAALSSLVTQTTAAYGVECSLVVAPAIPESDDTRRVQAYLTVREALLNAVKHASAKRVCVDYRFDAGWHRVAIEDDGRGIPADAAGRGVGLSSMDYRVRLIGGQLKIEHPPHGGTRVEVSWPQA